jgi:hypothetical protein
MEEFMGEPHETAIQAIYLNKAQVRGVIYVKVGISSECCRRSGHTSDSIVSIGQNGLKKSDRPLMVGRKHS